MIDTTNSHQWSALNKSIQGYSLLSENPVLEDKQRARLIEREIRLTNLGQTRWQEMKKERERILTAQLTNANFEFQQTTKRTERLNLRQSKSGLQKGQYGSGTGTVGRIKQDPIYPSYVARRVQGRKIGEIDKEIVDQLVEGKPVVIPGPIQQDGNDDDKDDDDSIPKPNVPIPNVISLNTYSGHSSPDDPENLVAAHHVLNPGPPSHEIERRHAGNAGSSGSGGSGSKTVTFNTTKNSSKSNSSSLTTNHNIPLSQILPGPSHSYPPIVAPPNTYPPPRPNHYYKLENRSGRHMIITPDRRGKVLTKIFMDGRWLYVP